MRLRSFALLFRLYAMLTISAVIGVSGCCDCPDGEICPLVDAFSDVQQLEQQGGDLSSVELPGDSAGVYDIMVDLMTDEPAHEVSPDVVLEAQESLDQSGGETLADVTEEVIPDVLVETVEVNPEVQPSPCPPLMALVDDSFCIDRYEAGLEQLVEGVWTPLTPYGAVDGLDLSSLRAVPAQNMPPHGYISGLQAQAACENAGKRLCASPEWLSACQGPQKFTYPYGANHIPGACNDDYPGGHPVCDYFGGCDGVWDSVHMNDPGINQQADTVTPGGGSPLCSSPWDVLDMHGNLHEWVADSGGVFRGGFYGDAKKNGAGCLYVTTAHAPSYHDYSTGFRCCADPQ